MADDDPFYVPGARLAPATPRPAERLWTMQRNGQTVAAELRYHGESYGVEIQFLYNGELAFGQRFVLRAMAMMEADVKRAVLARDGWVDA